MNLDQIKGAAFRYCDKAFLALVVLFVIWNVLSFMSPGDEALGPRSGGGGKPPIEPPEKMPNYYVDIVSPFLKGQVPGATALAHDPFWPQTVVMLSRVQLVIPAEPTTDPEKLARMKATRELSSPLVGKLDLWPIPDYFLRALLAGRARTASAVTALPTGPPSEVEVTIDPETRKILTFAAKKAGGWIGYQGNLENENKVRVVVRVYEGEVETPVSVLAPVAVLVEEEQLGHVVVRFSEQTLPRQDPTTTTTKKRKVEWVHADYFNIYRQAEGEAKMLPIGRVDGPGGSRRRTRRPREMEPMMEDMPPGYDPRYDPMAPPVEPRPRAPRYDIPPPGMSPEEMMEGGAPPVMPMPGRREPDRREFEREFRPEAGRSQFLHVDNSVESEVQYTYWIEAVALEEDEQILDSRYASSGKKTPGPGYPVTTAQKFTFAYIGDRMVKGVRKAKIVVFIGRRMDPIESREFTVPVGEWIGEAPGKPEADAEETEAEGTGTTAVPPPGVAASPDVRGEPPLREGIEGEEEDEGGQNYVTRHVLVDIVPDGRQLQENEVMISIDGKPVKVTAYKYVPKQKVIIRDRKNRLRELWLERIITPKPKTGRDLRDKSKRRRPGVPPGYEEMTPEMMEEMGPPPPRRPTRSHRR